MLRMHDLPRAAAAVLLAALTLMEPARAETAVDFYRGKTITVIVGFGAGGGFDLYARLVAKHLGRHIEGTPSVVVKNMPGAGGRIAADFITNVAPQDGTVIAFLPSAIVVDQLLDPGETRFDAAKFNWLGRLNDIAQVAVVWHTAPALTVEAAKEKEIVLAASSPLNLSATLPLAFNRMVGTKFKVIPGYTTDMVLAMERGETHGVGGTSWEPLRVSHSDLLRDNKIRMLYLMGITRHRDLPDVPTIVEFGKTEEDRQVFRLLGSISDIGRALVGGPQIPAERTRTLRNAIAMLVKDQAFVADSDKLGLGLNYLAGEPLKEIVDDLKASPKSVIEKTRSATTPQQQEKAR